MFDEKSYRKEYYLKNKQKILDNQKKLRSVSKEKIKVRQKNYYSTKDGRIVRLLAAAKKRAKQSNLPFDLDLEYLRSICPDICPVFKIQLDWGSWGEKNQRPLDNSPSVDKIVPQLGYVRGNVACISWKANRLKSNATWNDLLKLSEWLKGKINGTTTSTSSSIQQHTNGDETNSTLGHVEVCGSRCRGK